MAGQPVDARAGSVTKPGQLQIAIQFLTRAQQQRREDWAVARASFTVPGWGTSAGHTIHDFARRGRLSVQPAPGTILNPETKDRILAEYYRLGVPDRYAEERDLYGIYTLATCPDSGADPRAYIVHCVPVDKDGALLVDRHEYRRIEAPDLRAALDRAKGTDSPMAYAYGIMGADYAEARELGINFFEGDGLLL